MLWPVLDPQKLEDPGEGKGKGFRVQDLQRELEVSLFSLTKRSLELLERSYDDSRAKLFLVVADSEKRDGGHKM